MTKKKIILFFSSLFLIGCSLFTQKVESLTATNPNEQKSEAPVKRNLFCDEKSKIQLLLEDDSALKFYRSFSDNIFDKNAYSFIQKSVLLSLIELSRRPDEASPSSRLQYYLKYNGKSYYFDFRPKNLEDNSKMSFLKGLDYMLEKFDSSKSLGQLADTLDTNLPQNIQVSSELENFLIRYKKEIIKNESLANIFMKGDEVLTRHETFKRTSLKKIILLFNATKNKDIDTYEFDKNALFKIESKDSNLDLQCNTDINKDTPIKEELFLTDQKRSHYFGFNQGDNFFLATTSANIDKPLKNYDSTYFMKSSPSPIPLPICKFNTQIEDIILFSTSGRSPGQHLKHFVNYDIGQVDSIHSLNELLRFSRHLFLTTPNRILYESKKGRKTQLDFFLNMNFPIYHVENLGDVIGIANFNKGSSKEKSLIADERSKARLWCGQ